ncbi:TPA: MoaD/ThiS family protein [Candidatus Bathyarchaeota archaeon]|nr:MoaD/ThiS family protein [Candidatus Bathyarchaeota archaeon]
MKIKVLYLGVLRSKIGKNSEEYEIPNESSLSDLLEILSSKYGKSLRDIFKANEKSKLDPSIIATVNGVSRDISQAENVKLEDGDTVALMSLISGG